MVRRAALLLVLVAATAFAQGAAQSAAGLLPPPTELLPGMTSPAELAATHPAHVTAEQAREDCPAMTETAHRDLLRLRRMGDAEWERVTGALRVAGLEPSAVARAQATLIGAPGSPHPLRWAVLRAAAAGGGRDVAIAAVEQLAADLIDSDARHYVRPGTGGTDASWRVGVQVYGEDAMRRRWQEFDLAEQELDDSLPVWRAVAERDLVRWADDEARRIERELVAEATSTAPHQDRVQALQARLAELPGARTEVRAWRVAAGDSAHAVVVRTRWPGAAEQVQVTAQVRAGLVLFDVRCTATGDAAATIGEDVERVLGALGVRAGATPPK